MAIFYDQLDNVLTIDATPKRIICLVPSLTELLVDLGLEKNLVGITRFCIHPKNLKENKTIVGGTKKINFDKIKALKPDFILTNKEENTQEIVALVSNIAPTFVSDLNTIDAVLALNTTLGKLLNCQQKAKEINCEISRKKIDFLKFIKDKPSKKVAYFIWANPFMVAGMNTFINHLLQLNKFKNAYSNQNRYPEIDIKKIKKIDFILLSSEPYPFKEKHKAQFKKYSNAKIILVDGEYFSWYGSRLIKAFDYFKTLH